MPGLAFGYVLMHDMQAVSSELLLRESQQDGLPLFISPTLFSLGVRISSEKARADRKRRRKAARIARRHTRKG